MLENSIDAQAQHISIDIERGGSSIIRIMDDGLGIHKADLSLAVTRHATSKLSTLQELENIHSLGFRGEALASISAVSKLSICSKQPAQQAWMIDTGTETDFANYQSEPTLAAHPDGTTVEVRDLFYNTPARRKFLRTTKTEFKHIDDVVKRIALSHFDVAFKLTHNKKIIYQLPQAKTDKAIQQRIIKLFSKEFLEHANQVEFSTQFSHDFGSIRLWGWVSKPSWYRHQADWQYFYVNCRFIKDKLVNHALRQVCQELLPTDAYSVYILYLDIEPNQVDVNVHPTKHEVRFRQTRQIHDFIYSALNQAMGINPRYEENYEPAAAYKIPIKLKESTTDQGEYIHQEKGGVRPFASHQTYKPRTANFSTKTIAEHLSGLTQLYQPQTTAVDNEQKTAQSSQKQFIRRYFGESLGCLLPKFLFMQNRSGDVETLRVIHIQKALQFLFPYVYQQGNKLPLLVPESLSLTDKDIQTLMKAQQELKGWGIEFNQIAPDHVIFRSIPDISRLPGAHLKIEKFIQLVIHQFSIDVSSDSLNTQQAIQALLVNSIETKFLTEEQQQQLISILCEQIQQHDLFNSLEKQQQIWLTLDSSALEQLFN